MWFKKIKFRKLQYILVMVILMASAMIFSESLAYVQEVNAVLNDFYSAKNMPGIVVMSKGGGYDRIINNADIMKDIESTTLYNGKIDSGVVLHNGKAHTGGSLVFPVSDKNSLVYKLFLHDKNNLATAPGAQEIWIPYTYAGQNNIKIGDTFSLGDNGTYKITAFTISTTTATVFSQFIPFYINSVDYERFLSLPNYDLIFMDATVGVDAYATFLRAADVCSELLEAGGSRDSLADNDAMSTNITGNISIAAALIMFVAALFVLAYIIRSNIQKELCNIGIYKAMGFSDAKIKGIYFKSYLFIGVIAAVLGVLCGLPLIYMSAAPVVKYIGGFSLTGISAVCGVISVAVLSVLIIFCLVLALRKISNIKPVETLSMGLRSGTKKLKKSVIKSAHSPLGISINEIFKYRTTSILTIIMIVVAVLLSYTFGSFGHSLSFMDKKIGAYFNFPEGDAYIMDVYKNNNPDLLEDIASMSDVENIILSEMSFSTIKINGESMGVNFYKYNTFDPALTGIPYSKGRAPQNESEIALTPYVLKKLNIKVNDYAKIDFDGTGEKTYLIVGSYNSMVGSKISLQMLLTEQSTNNVLSYLSIHLKKNVNINTFKESVEKEFNGTFVYTAFPHVDKMADMIYGIVKTPVNITIAIFMGFSILIILNMLFMSYIDGRRSFGTLKALGFSTKYITQKSLCKMLILTIAGALLGLAAGAVFAPLIYSLIFGKNVFVFSTALPFIIAGILFAFVTGITLLFAIPINRIKAKELMED